MGGAAVDVETFATENYTLIYYKLSLYVVPIIQSYNNDADYITKQISNLERYFEYNGDKTFILAGNKYNTQHYQRSKASVATYNVYKVINILDLVTGNEVFLKKQYKLINYSSEDYIVPIISDYERSESTTFTKLLVFQYQPKYPPKYPPHLYQIIGKKTTFRYLLIKTIQRQIYLTTEQSEISFWIHT